MTRLPLEPQRIRWHLVEHQLPSGRIMGKIPIPRSPVAPHRTVLKGKSNALVVRTTCKFSKDLPKPRHGIGDRLTTNTAREAGYHVAAKEMRGVDQRFPPRQCLLVDGLVFQLIPEYA